MRWGKRKMEVSQTELREWFAWHPVRFEDGRYAWLEKVRRRMAFYYTGSEWEYFPIN